MKKLIFGFGLALISMFVHAQNGLENIVVEKYYISNGADLAGSATHGTLPVGSVTYRIYVDMLPGYKFQMAYGNMNHNLIMTTSTTFYNNTDGYNSNLPTYSRTNAAKNTMMVDSWLSAGGCSSTDFGVMKSEDNGVNNIVNINGILANTAALMGIPLTTQDGYMAGVPSSTTIIGMDGTVPADNGAGNVFGDGTANGSSFILTGSAWSSLAGAQGPTATNRVLIAQITTDGIFHYALNIQIGTPTGGTEVYVASNPLTPNGNGINEISIPSLTGTLNVAPTVSITSPANNTNLITGNSIAINATAADADGTVTQVQFFVDGVSIGTDNLTPFTVNYTGVTGTHTLTAVATDNDGLTTTSAPITLIVAPNQAPTVSITAPVSGTNFTTGDVVAIAATAADVDGTVAQVEFFVDGTSIGIDNTLPYTANYTSVLGPHTIVARATDNLGLFTNSTTINITVLNNVPPTVSITAPTNGTVVTQGTVVTINATAADANGTVTQVQFFVNGVSVGIDATLPYSITWTSVAGTAALTAVATDNLGATTTSAVVNINVLDPNALPYQIGTVYNSCAPEIFSVPFIAVDTVHNVIGYDLTINWDANMVTPTGIITKMGDLMNANYFDVSQYYDLANSRVNIALSLNPNAPVGSFFTNVGKLFTIGFSKNTSFNAFDTTVFTVTNLTESYYNGVQAKLATNGRYITSGDSTFQANLVFWNTNLPILYNAVNPNQFLITNIYGMDNNCANQSIAAVQPDDSLGQFVYDYNNGPSIKIDRDILGTVDLISVLNAGTDVFYAKKVITMNPDYVPNIYKMLAMDVNQDGVVSAGDVSQLSQRIVLMIPEFKQAWNYDQAGNPLGPRSKDWVFISESMAMNYPDYQISANFPSADGIGYSKTHVPVVPTCLPVPIQIIGSCSHLLHETYQGVMLGDVDGSYLGHATDGFIKAETELATDTVVFDLAHAAYTPGFVSVPVFLKSASVINGVDFATKFNETKLQFDTVMDQTTYLDDYSYFNTTDRTIRVTATSLTGGAIQANTVLFMIRFVNLDGAMSVADLDSLHGYINGSATIIKVTTPAVGIETNDVLHSIQIYPNPATDVVKVIVAENATMQLFDFSGKLVLDNININANETNSIDLSTLANGVYSIKLFNNSFVKLQKIVIAK